MVWYAGYNGSVRRSLRHCHRFPSRGSVLKNTHLMKPGCTQNRQASIYLYVRPCAGYVYICVRAFGLHTPLRILRNARAIRRLAGAHTYTSSNKQGTDKAASHAQRGARDAHAGVATKDPAGKQSTAPLFAALVVCAELRRSMHGPSWALQSCMLPRRMHDDGRMDACIP